MKLLGAGVLLGPLRGCFGTARIQAHTETTGETPSQDLRIHSRLLRKSRITVVSLK